LPKVRCPKTPLPNIGETFEQMWIFLLRLMGRLVGMKLEKIMIMSFDFDMGELER